MNKWELILVGGAITYALRAFPMLVLRRIDLGEDSNLSKFFNYAAYSVMGGIISLALYGERLYQGIGGHFERGELLKLLAVSAAVFIAASTRSIIKALLVCVSGYAFLMWAS
jgi:branched-subunit amino acid transport protein